jgi:hypothetical protein
MKAGSKYWDALDPFFERIFILGGARGTPKKTSRFGLRTISTKKEEEAITVLHRPG